MDDKAFADRDEVVITGPRSDASTRFDLFLTPPCPEAREASLHNLNLRLHKLSADVVETMMMTTKMVVMDRWTSLRTIRKR